MRAERGIAIAGTAQMCLGNRGLFRQELDEAGVHLDVEQTKVLSELLERRSGRLEPLS